MKQDIILKVSLSISAAKSIVWKALVEPEQIKKYFFGTDTKTTWKVGSPITFSGEWEGKPYMDKGTVLQFEPEKMLKYNYWSSFSGTEDVPANYANITYAIDEKDGKTTLTIIQDGIKSEESRAHSEKNWLMVMNNMKTLVEK
ncbi:MAG TPA: SRPBCC domain-containing protein [Cyclobacteriaceae bacterium]|jgi:uncharacterized protein YndB with AHSA1/START domain|nr:SRPBCC domain-containing protein [Cyclobacteriaceae bacterium]